MSEHEWVGLRCPRCKLGFMEWQYLSKATGRVAVACTECHHPAPGP